MILRASTAWLTSLQGFAAQLSLNSTRPPPQSGPANATQYPTSAIAAAIVPGSQTISAPGYGQYVLTIPAIVVRQLAGAAAANMPSEALQLSQEACVDAQGMWPAALQAIGFTAGFVPSVTPVPTVNC